MLLQKLLLTGAPTSLVLASGSCLIRVCGTGLIIFIRPQTTTQLGAGFAFSIFFFCLHVQTNAYKSDLEDQLQFCAMLSITLTLFGGLLLKAQTEITTEDSTAAEEALMALLLLAINIGVVVLMCYQVFLTFRKGPANSQVVVTMIYNM